jgi:hypothetical protein
LLTVLLWATRSNRRGTAFEDIADQVYGIADVREVITISISAADRIRHGTTFENVAHKKYRIAGIDLPVAVDVPAGKHVRETHIGLHRGIVIFTCHFLVDRNHRRIAMIPPIRDDDMGSVWCIWAILIQSERY